MSLETEAKPVVDSAFEIDEIKIFAFSPRETMERIAASIEKRLEEIKNFNLGNIIPQLELVADGSGIFPANPTFEDRSPNVLQIVDQHADPPTKKSIGGHGIVRTESNSVGRRTNADPVRSFILISLTVVTVTAVGYEVVTGKARAALANYLRTNVGQVAPPPDNVTGSGEGPAGGDPSNVIGPTPGIGIEEPTIVVAPTDEPKAETPVDISKYLGLPGSFAEFQSGTMSLVFDDLTPQLEATQPLFAEDAPAVWVQKVTDPAHGNDRLVLACNEGEFVNCEPVAFVLVNGNYVVILKIKNDNGTNGFFPWLIKGGDITKDDFFNDLIANPTGPRRIIIQIGQSESSAVRNPYQQALINRADFQEAMQRFFDEGNYPKDFHEIIPASSVDT